jgi:hypothetical protein
MEDGKGYGKERVIEWSVEQEGKGYRTCDTAGLWSHVFFFHRVRQP